MSNNNLENNEFWDFYWEMRLKEMENLGKRVAILAASRLIRRLAQNASRPLRILELGCGEGQVVGALVDAHAPQCDSQVVIGVDYNAQSLARCRKDYPGWRFEEGDFTDASLLERLGKYDVILLVNALHEVFSAGFSQELGEVDVPAAKERAALTLAGAADRLPAGAWMVLFDGLEPAGDPRRRLRVRFLDREVREDFDRFAQQYQPFRISYRGATGALTVELSQRDFTRYITKSIFLRKHLWENERKESYQYFTEEEFRAAFARASLEITELRTLTVNREKWQRLVRIETPGMDFPQEHILIIAKKAK
ncbi:MAG TPA: methyltransferase domain-containing protein [Anaerolineaceae bacterium]